MVAKAWAGPFPGSTYVNDNREMEQVFRFNVLLHVLRRVAHSIWNILVRVKDVHPSRPLGIGKMIIDGQHRRR